MSNSSYPIWGQPSATVTVSGNGTRAAVSSNYSVLATDRYIGITSPSAGLTITLPAASSFPVGVSLTIQDESGQLGGGAGSVAAATLALAKGGDTIDGATTLLMRVPYGGVILFSDGSTKWVTTIIAPQVTTMTDADYTILRTDTTVATGNSLTAPRTLTLPSAASYPAGVRLLIIDMGAVVTGVNTLTIARSGTDTIEGSTTLVLNTQYNGVALLSNGSTRWVRDKTVGASTGLGDPGGNGIVKRTGLNTTAVASVGLDYFGDTGSNGLIKRTALFTAATATKGVDYVDVVRSTVGDANYSVLTTDRYIGITAALTTARTHTLPAANTFPAGVGLTIADEAGGVTATNSILIARAGADTINGATSLTLLNSPYERSTLYSDGTSKWTAIKGLYLADPGNNGLVKRTAQNTTSAAVSGTDYCAATSGTSVLKGNAGSAVSATGGVDYMDVKRTASGDANYAVLTSDRYIGLTTAFTLARTLTLPAASAFPVGVPLVIADEAGVVTSVNTLTIARGGGDLIDNGASIIISGGRQSVVLFSDGTSKWSRANKGGADVQVFLANGTWTKPLGTFQTARVLLIGGGSGGGSGRKGAAGTNRGGGGGGGFGGFTDVTFAFGDLGATVAVTVGTGGAGGISQTTNSTDGNAGTNGGFSLFGNFAAASGPQSGGGGGTGAAGGAGGTGCLNAMFNGDSGAAGGFGAAGVNASASVTTPGIIGAGGGGGGGISAANTAFNGGSGGTSRSSTGGTAAAGGVAPGGAGSAALNPGTSSAVPGFGGAGGAGSTAGTGGSGSAGTIGAGGGGGGASVDAVGNSGAGGAGGGGIVVVICAA